MKISTRAPRAPLYLAAFLTVLAATQVRATPAFVANGSASFTSSTTGEDDQVDFVSTLPAGTFIYMAFVYQAMSGPVINSITDDLGDDFQYVLQPFPARSGWMMAVMYTFTKTAGNPMITYHLGPHNIVSVETIAYSGVDTTAPFEPTYATAPGSTTHVTCGSITTTTAEDLIVVTLNDSGDRNASRTAPTPYINRSGLTDAMEMDGPAATIGTYTPTADTTAPPWFALTMALRPAGSGAISLSDAGSASDAGASASMDGGSSGGSDAGTGSDAGVLNPDGGMTSVTDAGTTSSVDAGRGVSPSTDGGLPSDAGVSTHNGGSDADGGTDIAFIPLPDGGLITLRSNLGCATGGNALPAAGILVGLAVLLVSRRRLLSAPRDNRRGDLERPARR